MYYAGLRPEEAINLSHDNVILSLKTSQTTRTGRAAHSQRDTRCGQRMDRRRQRT